MASFNSKKISHIHQELHSHLPSEPALRTKALESLLTEKQLIDPAAVDAWIEMYRDEIGPKRGAAVVARAWRDPGFKARLLTNGTTAIDEFGFAGHATGHLQAVENTADVHNLVVCTLCSCYPFSILGLSPSWYKSNEYRARAVRDPRGVLEEFGVKLDDKTQVRVWDSTSERRHLVVPERPKGVEDWDEAALANLVTRNSMIGTERDLFPQAGDSLMDGVHDLGGREGYGPIVGKTDDKMIHADWEIRDFAMKQSSAMGQSWTVDWFRHCRELGDPIDYLTRPYYDQWLTTLAARLIDEGYLSLEEIKRGVPAFAAKPGLPPQTAEAARAIVKRARSFAVNVNTPPRYALGTAVRCRLDGGSGHTRLPGYVRGRAGVIHAHHGGHVFADASARGEERGEHLYTVSFASSDLCRRREEAATACSSISGRAILNRPELGFLKAKDGEPVFGEPWHAQTLALADLLVKSGGISSTRWAETLGAEIKTLNAEPDDRETYYRAVLAALERLLAENGSVTPAELHEREHQWERAYLRTPHGHPVELAAGLEPE